jgi:hypothetical protein
VGDGVGKAKVGEGDGGIDSLGELAALGDGVGVAIGVGVGEGVGVGGGGIRFSQ